MSLRFIKPILFLIFNSLIFIGCFWFSNYRYQQKNNLEVIVNYTNPPRFLNDSLVNKLLTQNLPLKYCLRKDSLDLNILESKMNKIPEVKNVEIFVLPKGKLSLCITERKPLFKVDSDPPLYSDINGVLFNYKRLDSLHYPTFQTISSTISLENSANMIKILRADPFLSRELDHVILIKDKYQLKLKSFDFNIIFGSPTRVKEKIKKLKVFCTFQNVQDSLNFFKKINLSYNNQVVATTS